MLLEEKMCKISCFKLDKITVETPPMEKDSYRKLCSKFYVEPQQIRRPALIDILISMRQNLLHPVSVKTIG